MKKIAITTLVLYLCYGSRAQTPWGTDLNTINPPENPNLGTANNEPLNFFTNGTQRMSLGTNGVLNISGLSGTGSRFLHSDASGNLTPWTGSAMYSNSILFGDGTWKPNLITVDGSNMFIPQSSRFGLGVTNPSAELDVSGNAKISNSFGVENTIYIGSANNFATLKYVPESSTSPALFKIGGGGISNPNNPSQGNNFNQPPWNGGGAEDDPQPDWACISGESTPNNLPPSATILNNVLCVKKMFQTSPNSVALAGNINIGHNGYHAYIETQGASLNNSGHEGDLFVNSKCNRNVYFFSNTNAFAPGLTSVMSIDGKLNITQNLQIGASQANSFLNANTQVYIYSPVSVPIGLKLRHGGGGESAIKIIELSDNDKAISINKGTPTLDGTERFSVLANGYTEINVQTPLAMPNNRVLTIKDVPNNRDLFVVKSDGKVYAREVEISLVSSFPDYVFDKSYNLLSISQVEKYIQIHKHLPGFQKGEFYNNNGLVLNDVILKQQEKIEEMMLYIIELEKRISKIEREDNNE